jgi:hypothetical protein
VNAPFSDVKPWPKGDENPRVTIGDNRPPVQEQGVGDFNDAIDGHPDLRKRITDLIESSTRANAVDDDSAGRCAELVRQMSAAEKVVDGEREQVKRPYLEAGRRIDDAAKTLVGNLSQAKTKVRGLTETYMRDKLAKENAERRRIEDEQRRDREAAEQAARAEAALAAEQNRAPDPEIMEAPITVSARPVAVEPTQVRSDFGAVASARKIKIAEIVDWKKAFNAVKDVPAVQEAVQKAVNALMRAGKAEIPGVTIRDDIGLSVR